jgi:hypothetical protein
MVGFSPPIELDVDSTTEEQEDASGMRIAEEDIDESRESQNDLLNGSL